MAVEAPAATQGAEQMIDARMFTVGPVQENCFIVREKGASNAVIVDPGDEPEKLLGAIEQLGITTVEAILVTHTHFDHIGAVAPVAAATKAPVWCPEIEKPVLANIMEFVPWPGFGPFESYKADHTVEGGETLTLANMTIDVISTPGHSPGHVTYAVRDEPDDASAARNGEAGSRAGRELAALFSGDVLFMGSVGRVDLPGGDWQALLASVKRLLDRYGADAVVYPGHGEPTTLGRELETNPFLAELRAA
jgi:glyoxylase-like metal-dependent hydrolase (beta-lactamase superfamily II)